MAYELRSEKGVRICKDGEPVIASDSLQVKIEQLDDSNKSFVAIASTEDEDRDKDIVRQAGWKLANFKKNPIIPWSHNYYSVPIARSIKTWIDKDNKKGPRLLFMPKFDKDDDNSMNIYNKYKNGFLTSFSVGFRGIKFTFRNEEDRWWGGREFLQQELLEISAVAIPANPNANTRLSISGENEPENLVQLGYPEMFAKTSSGLFYPVMDMATFSQPKEFSADEGVIAIRATPLDGDIDVKHPVAYFFDPQLFDDKSANDWVNANAPGQQQIKYYNIGIDTDGKFTLSSVMEESGIKRFEASIDLSNMEVSDENVSEKDSDGEDDGADDPNNKSEGKEEDTEVSDDNSDKSVNENELDEKGEENNDDSPNSEFDDVDKLSDPDIVVPVKSIIEVVTTIKDYSGNIIDQSTETVASSREIKSVDEYAEIRSNKLISVLKSEIAGLKKTITGLHNEKDLANNTEISDNKSDLNDSDEDGQLKSSNDEEIIELDESLIQTPGDNDDKTNSQIIEIDDSLLESTNSDAKNVVNTALAKRLRDSLREALQGASGRID